MTNPRKNKIAKTVWFLPNEYEELINALEGNFADDVVDVIFKIWKRGDL